MPDPIVQPGQTVRAGPINALVQPHVQAYVANFTLPVGASTYTAVSYTTTLSSNTPSMWNSGQPTRLVAPSAGVYLIHGGVTWTGSLGTADGRGEIRANGASGPSLGTRVGTQRGSNGNMQSTVSGIVVLAANGYIELYLNHGAAGSVSVTVTLGITRVSAT